VYHAFAVRTRTGATTGARLSLIAVLGCALAACGENRRPQAAGAPDSGTEVAPPADPCAPSPCENGGACSPAADGGFACACAPGYAGVTCASNIDDCLPNPCRNGGTCVDGVNSATCVCPPATTGDRCELPRFQSTAATPCGGAVVATAVTDDGRTVIGFCGSHAAMLWSLDGGFADLGITNAIATDAIPIAVDADGGAFLSRFRRDDGSSGVLRWSAGAGTTDLLLQAADAVLLANAGSRDLGVLVGAYVDATLAQGYQLAFRFTPDAGLVKLDVPVGSTAGCGAFAVNADGTVAAGACYDAAGVQRVARWRVAGDAIPVDLLDTSPGASQANAVSGDGRVLVGYAFGDRQIAHQFRLEGDGPLEDLGGLPNAENANALAVSFDGSVVVGIAEMPAYPFTDYPTVWDRQNGMRAVTDVLTGYGVDTTGWYMPSADLVSGDGKVIVGNGIGPDGIGRFWIARLY
jgi:uncharacterized membrane protein